jgi:hypothetical protein
VANTASACTATETHLVLAAMLARAPRVGEKQRERDKTNTQSYSLLRGSIVWCGVRQPQRGAGADGGLRARYAPVARSCQSSRSACRHDEALLAKTQRNAMSSFIDNDEDDEE